ncbi:MAG: hypothetical protein R3E68_05020 [Burkholderiaceae bacterium]
MLDLVEGRVPHPPRMGDTAGGIVLVSDDRRGPAQEMQALPADDRARWRRLHEALLQHCSTMSSLSALRLAGRFNSMCTMAPVYWDTQVMQRGKGLAQRFEGVGQLGRQGGSIQGLSPGWINGDNHKPYRYHS